VNYYSEKDIRDIVTGVLAQSMGPRPAGAPILVEVSARHVHLTKEDVEVLFGPGRSLTRKRDLSQPGEFLSEERVKLVTAKGEIANVAVLGPERKATQVELSLTDTRSLGIKAPVNLSGNLTGAGDVIIVGPNGVLEAKGSVIVARAHIHMPAADAASYGVHDGQCVSLKVETERGVTFDQVVVRISPNFALAAHVDFDEANAAGIGKDARGIILK